MFLLPNDIWGGEKFKFSGEIYPKIPPPRSPLVLSAIIHEKCVLKKVHSSSYQAASSATTTLTTTTTLLLYYIFYIYRTVNYGPHDPRPIVRIVPKTGVGGISRLKLKPKELHLLKEPPHWTSFSIYVFFRASSVFDVESETTTTTLLIDRCIITHTLHLLPPRVDAPVKRKDKQHRGDRSNVVVIWLFNNIVYVL